jgi:hypothetical protein
MLESIKYKRSLGYNAATKLYEYEFELIDSDFSWVGTAAGASRFVSEAAVGALIQEYSKRKLNVAANLIRFFRFYEKKWSYSIELQIELAQKYQPLFTPELKAELDKYLTLL